MISIAMENAGAVVATPPAVGVCSVDQAAWTAQYAAPATGTGLSSTGATPIRLRGRIAAAGTATGAFFGATVRPSVTTTALPGSAVVGVPVEHTSNTPGDLPPEDPPS